MRKTHAEFCNQINIINPNILILGEYIKNNKKIKCQCKIDNHIWEPIPCNLIKGSGCPKCASKKISERRTLTFDTFMDRLYSLNKNIEVLGEFIDSQTNLLCRCKIDNYTWNVRPSHLLSGHGCPKCGGVLLKTHEEFIDELKNINNNIDVIGIYKNNHTPIQCKCKIDDYVWNPKPMKLLTRGCPKCGGTLKLTHNEFVNRVNILNNNIEIISNYKSMDKYIQCKCKLDGFIWTTTASNLVKNKPTGCPKCNESKGEKAISVILNKNNIFNIAQKTFNDLFGINNGLLSYDFYLPNYNLLIEYQGEQHEKYYKGFHKSKKEFEKQLEHDRRKSNYCINNNIQLLEIWYYDFDNIEKILKHVLKL